MTRYDLPPDDEPLDIQAVHEDDALVERLRHALSPEASDRWDDDQGDMDPGYALLRALQIDVSSDLPTESILPAEVIELLPRRRHLSRTATVAVLAAGVLSIGGAAAASAPGQPLAGVRHAVSDAVSTAVSAITPDAPASPKAVRPETLPSPKPTPPGDAVSDAARSANAILQIEANLAKAARFLDDGKTEPAKAQLDAAARKLVYVTDAAQKTRLQGLLTALQTRLAAVPAASPKASHGPADDKGKGNDNRGSNNGKSEPAASHSPNANASSSARSHSSRTDKLDKVKNVGSVGDLRSTPHRAGQNNGLR
jgi:hypothetical protein